MNEEMLKKLGDVKTPEDVAAIAKEYGKELTLEQAEKIFERVKTAATGTLPDDVLEAVNGGCSSCGCPDIWTDC